MEDRVAHGDEDGEASKQQRQEVDEEEDDELWGQMVQVGDASSTAARVTNSKNIDRKAKRLRRGVL